MSAYQLPLEMQTLIELRGQPGECARSLRARYVSTAVCEGPLDKEQRRRPPELEELECARRDNRRPTQAGRAARPQKSMDDDESTKVSYGTDREPAAEGRCRRRLSWTERRPQGANWAGNRIVVGGGRKTAGHFISGAGYRSQWPRYATGDLGSMRGKLFVSLQASC